MQFFEGILAIVLSTFLLILIICVSQSVKTMFEKLDRMKTDLALENSMVEIPLQKLGDAENLLSEVVGILSSNRIRWVSIEFLSEKHGRIFVENKVSAFSSGQDARYVQIVRISSEDTVVITVSLEK